MRKFLFNIIILLLLNTLTIAQNSLDNYFPDIDTTLNQLRIDNMIAMLDTVQETNIQNSIKLNIGKVYFDVCDYATALNYYNEVLEYSKKKNAISVQVIINREIGKIMMQI